MEGCGSETPSLNKLINTRFIVMSWLKKNYYLRKRKLISVKKIKKKKKSLLNRFIILIRAKNNDTVSNINRSGRGHIFLKAVHEPSKI